MRILEALVAAIFLLIATLAIFNRLEYYSHLIGKNNPYALPAIASFLAYSTSLPGDFWSKVSIELDNESEIRIYYGYNGQHKIAIGYCQYHDFWEELKMAALEGIYDYVMFTTAEGLSDLLISASIDLSTEGKISDETLITAAGIVTRQITKRVSTKITSKIASKVASKVLSRFISTGLKALTGTGWGIALGLTISVGINAAATLWTWWDRTTNWEINCRGDSSLEYFEIEYINYMHNPLFTIDTKSMDSSKIKVDLFQGAIRASPINGGILKNIELEKNESGHIRITFKP